MPLDPPDPGELTETCVCVCVCVPLTPCSVNFVSYFRFSLGLKTKIHISFSHILVIVFLLSFSLVLVNQKSLYFSQLLVITFSQNVLSF